MSSTLLIKELRQRTGAGFLDCKKALEASNNDVEKAIVWLQEKGVARAAKKAGSIAAEGIVKTAVSDTHAVIFELNSQTDFVATNDQFQKLAQTISDALLSNDFSTIEEANAIKVNETTIADLCIKATATIGEKIQLRRAIRIEKNNLIIGAYTHVNKRVAAIVVTDGGSDEIARNVAMHVASMNPQFLDESSVPADKVAAMKAEIEKSPALEGKPDNIKENIAKGMLRKSLSELTLVDQEFVMEKMPVSKYLANGKAVAKAMYRFEVGEGIEKAEVNFADEVKAQMNL